MWRVLLAPVAVVAGAPAEAAPGPPHVRGGITPRVYPESWPVWTPPVGFAETFAGWADEPAEELLAWCKAFIPAVNTSGVQRVYGNPVVPLTLPLVSLPLPGYRGQCALIDGRDWAPGAAFEEGRPDDSRFGAYLRVARGQVQSRAACGMSHNLCCQEGGCGGARYGAITCGPVHCPDDNMRVRRVRCWTSATDWSSDGVDCEEAAARNSTVLAVKAYVQGRGGDPCVKPLGVSAPPATWDIGLVLFPTKRRALVTGYVDDAPATECYVRAKDAGGGVATAVLSQLPMPGGDVATKLVGFSDRPLNPAERVTHVPRPGGELVI